MERSVNSVENSKKKVSFSHIVNVYTPNYDYSRRDSTRIDKLRFKHRIMKTAEIIEPALIRKWFTMRLAMEHNKKVRAEREQAKSKHN